jgi:hypothetical protein
MLNELSLIVDAVERMGAKPTSRHPRINPMGKNKDALVVGLNADGAPSMVETLPGTAAGELFRVEHGAAGSSFPGFNIPAPLQDLEGIPSDRIGPLIEKLLAAAKGKNAGSPAICTAIFALYTASTSRGFTATQEKQFQRSCIDLVNELHVLLGAPSVKLINFSTLLGIVQRAKPTLSTFSAQLAALLVSPAANLARVDLLITQNLLFGTLDWKKRTAPFGSPIYWQEKAKQDKNANQPLYLDLAAPDVKAPRVAHRGTSKLLNEALIRSAAKGDRDSSSNAAISGNDPSLGIDAFSGRLTQLQDKYPSPKIAELGNLMLFSVNSKEVGALRRYGLGGSATFPAASSRVQSMNDALLFLGSEERRGSTCRAIPSAQNGKRDLLVVYLENDTTSSILDSTEIGASPSLAEMFGGETNAFSDSDFVARSQAVLELFDGRLRNNPDLRIRVIAFASIDKGRKQASFNRSFKAADIIAACEEWNAGLAGLPRITIWSWDKESKSSIYHTPKLPTPLDLASAINRVWSADTKLGYSYNSHRAFTASDAYDVFVSDTPHVSHDKAKLALSLLVARMAPVLATVGRVKTTRKWTDLSDTVRLQSLKTIALLNILLRKTTHRQLTHATAMKEPLYQLGQILALADSLHHQYCKHVRDGQMPSQLIGNALFNTALEQPVFALARLSERIVPYHAWAKTFSPIDQSIKSGWEKVVLGKLRECSSRFVEDVNGTLRIRTDEFPDRMSDGDKAKLLLGYLADTYEPKDSSET